MSTVAPGAVWRTLVGQHQVAETLARAAAGQGMTHAWLFTGPPGSGRSNAAMAFAAALQCPRGGCGECHACTTALAGTHPDVTVVRTERSMHLIDDIRDLVVRSALFPSQGRWQIIMVEDADRLGDAMARTSNALLKTIEEPTPHTVWLLCAPTVEDVAPTIRSRCRSILLGTPTAAEVAQFLVEHDGTGDALAAFAARASQGHIGRARALARDEATRNRRREVVGLPGRLTSLGACMNAAANLIDIAKDETEAITSASNAQATADLDRLYGDDRKSKQSRSYQAAVKALAYDQKQRQKRREMDVIDRSLMDITSVYRDAIALQSGASGALVNEESRTDVADLARRTTPESNLRRIDAIFFARNQMGEFNATPLLTLEAMMIALKV